MQPICCGQGARVPSRRGHTKKGAHRTGSQHRATAAQPPACCTGINPVGRKVLPHQLDSCCRRARSLFSTGWWAASSSGPWPNSRSLMASTVVCRFSRVIVGDVAAIQLVVWHTLPRLGRFCSSATASEHRPGDRPHPVSGAWNMQCTGNCP